MSTPNSQNNLRKIAEEAWRELSSMRPDDIARRAMSELADDSIRFSYIGSSCEVRLKEKRVLLDGKEQNPFKSLVIVHYLIGAKDRTLTGQLISFRELWGGDVYYDAFASRAILPIAEHFGPEPEKLIEAGKLLHARILEMGDASIELLAFPRIPLTYVVWKGDEELPHSANILFDSTINEHLPTEDISVLSSLTTGRLLSLRKDVN